MRMMLAMAMSLATACTMCSAGEVEDAARGILEKQQNAVVTVQLVVKEKMSFPGEAGQDNESKMEVTGTVISPDGLTLVALSDTDRSSMFANFMPDEMSGQFKIESVVSDVKILLDAGKEIDAAVVLRDKDLDLAFVRPKAKPETPLAFVDLAQSGTAQVLDHVVTLNRLGKVANRTASVSIEYIEAIVTKPRTFYFPGSAATMSGTGSPAFTLDGKALGVFVTRTISDKSGGMDMQRVHAVVVLPAADILEAAQQAPPFGQEPQESATEATPEAAPAQPSPTPQN